MSGPWYPSPPITTTMITTTPTNTTATTTTTLYYYVHWWHLATGVNAITVAPAITVVAFAVVVTLYVAIATVAAAATTSTAVTVDLVAALLKVQGVLFLLLQGVLRGVPLRVIRPFELYTLDGPDVGSVCHRQHHWVVQVVGRRRGECWSRRAVVLRGELL
jgi:hypothetical protein